MGKPKAPKTTTTSNTNQTQTVTPWGPTGDALTGMVEQAQKAYAATPKTAAFTGPNEQQQQAAQFLTDYAPKTAAGSQSILDLAQKTASGGFINDIPTFNSNDNPNIEALIAASMNPLREQLDANVLSIGDAAKLAGAYGGDRQELSRGTAVRGFNNDAMQMSSGIRYNAHEASQQRALQAYQTQVQAQQAERDRQQQAAALFTQGNQLGMQPAQILAALGDQTMGWADKANAQAVDAPWAGMDRLATILGQTTPYATTNTVGTGTTTGTQTAGGGGLQGGISGAIGGASAGSAFGPWGAGIGAVVGGLGGLFG